MGPFAEKAWTGGAGPIVARPRGVGAVTIITVVFHIAVPFDIATFRAGVGVVLLFSMHVGFLQYAFFCRSAMSAVLLRKLRLS